MFAWMHSCHGHIFQEGEWLNSQRFIEIFLLYILFNKLIINRFAINIRGTEEHSGCEVVFVIDDVHVVESNVFLFGFGLVVALENDHLITVRCLNHLLFAFCCAADSTAADGFLVNQVLLLVVKVL